MSAHAFATPNYQQPLIANPSYSIGVSAVHQHRRRIADIHASALAPPSAQPRYTRKPTRRRTKPPKLRRLLYTSAYTPLRTASPSPFSRRSSCGYSSRSSRRGSPSPLIEPLPNGEEKSANRSSRRRRSSAAGPASSCRRVAGGEQLSAAAPPAPDPLALPAPPVAVSPSPVAAALPRSSRGGAGGALACPPVALPAGGPLPLSPAWQTVADRPVQLSVAEASTTYSPHPPRVSLALTVLYPRGFAASLRNVWIAFTRAYTYAAGQAARVGISTGFVQVRGDGGAPAEAATRTGRCCCNTLSASSTWFSRSRMLSPGTPAGPRGTKYGATGITGGVIAAAAAAAATAAAIAAACFCSAVSPAASWAPLGPGDPVTAPGGSTGTGTGIGYGYGYPPPQPGQPGGYSGAFPPAPSAFALVVDALPSPVGAAMAAPAGYCIAHQLGAHEYQCASAPAAPASAPAPAAAPHSVGYPAGAAACGCWCWCWCWCGC
eukprot:1065644-Prorocentrum_minimum.AAC.1